MNKFDLCYYDASEGSMASIEGESLADLKQQVVYAMEEQCKETHKLYQSELTLDRLVKTGRVSWLEVAEAFQQVQQEIEE